MISTLERMFHTTLAIQLFNNQFKTNYAPEEFLMFSVPAANGQAYGYEFYKPNSPLRLRLYFNLANAVGFSPYWLTVDTTNGAVEGLGDEIWVAQGNMEQYLHDCGDLKLPWIDQNNLLGEDLYFVNGEPFYGLDGFPLQSLGN